MLRRLIHMSCLLSLMIFSSLGFAADQDVYEEARIQKMRELILAGDFQWSLSSKDQSLCLTSERPCLSDYDLFITALSENPIQLDSWLNWLNNQPVSGVDRLHAAWTFREQRPTHWLTLAPMYALGETHDPRLSHIFAESLNPVGEDRVGMAKDLLTHAGDFQGVRMYMFCREDRRYPCLLVQRNLNGQLVKENGKVWSQPALGFSRHEKKFNEVNGNTPSGVFHIDGVMPVADNQQFYGKFRRLILNYLPSSKGESAHINYLPASSHKASWWKEAVIARDMGRGLFRIHGTGNPSPIGEPYFPFFGTSGCVAQREGLYENTDYRDQRLLLDRLMATLGLAPIFQNEADIKGTLFVININSEQKAVTFSDLQKLKIL